MVLSATGLCEASAGLNTRSQLRCLHTEYRGSSVGSWVRGSRCIRDQSRDRDRDSSPDRDSSIDNGRDRDSSLNRYSHREMTRDRESGRDRDVSSSSSRGEGSSRLGSSRVRQAYLLSPSSTVNTRKSASKDNRPVHTSTLTRVFSQKTWT